MKWIVFIAAIAIAGCATGAQQQMTQNKLTVAETFKKYKACAEPLNENLNYAPLWIHTFKYGTHSNLLQLSDQTKITDADRASFLAWRADITSCRPIIDGLAAADPAFVSIIRDAQSSADAVRVRLIQRQITWGEANTEIEALDRQSAATLTAEDKRLGSELAAENRAELERRQAAMQAVAQSMQQQQALQQQQQQNQQLINAINRPVNTSCNRMGTFTNCTSY